MLYVGCAIWAYDGWHNGFYPAGLPKNDRLRAYGQRFNTVEVNSTFYALPSLETFQKWRRDVSDDFRFCPKFPKSISHVAQLHNMSEPTAFFLERLAALDVCLGPLMLQFSAGFGPNNIEVLRAYLKALPKHLRVALEVRHTGWFSPKHSAALTALLAETNAARIAFDSRPIYASKAEAAVLAQEKKPQVPLVTELAAGQTFALVRYISSPIREENDAYLDEWAPRIAAWLAEGRQVYFFAHCPVEELSPDVARALYHRVAALHPLPALGWDTLDSTSTQTPPASQLSLF
jgi:uncharacterized protein YecE (DUF72 family)